MECTMNMCERVRIFIEGKGELLHSNHNILFTGCIMVWSVHLTFLSTCQFKWYTSVLSGSFL